MRLFKTLFFYFTAAFLLSGCLGTKYLKEDENLLYKQRVKVSKEIDKGDLEQLYAQQPNRQFPIIPFAPYVWFYYWGSRSYDIEKYENKKENIREKFDEKIAATEDNTSKKQRLEQRKRRKLAKVDKTIQDGNTLMRWGEPVAVYDTTQTQTTLERFDLYLDSKGYFHAEISHKTRSIGNRIISSYEIDPGPAYIIDTLMLQTGDSAITELIYENEEESELKLGENYEQANLTKERERLDLLLKDNGYFDFSRQYIQFEIDTAFTGSQQVAIKTLINKPRRGSHQVFEIDSVNYITDANVKQLPDSLRITEEYRGVTYRFFDRRYSKKVLNRRVFIRKDSLYSKTKSFNTQRQLANLDHFKFININYDSTGGKLIANIYTSPLSRYQWSNEVGVNVTQGFPGPFYNISFKKRNVFKGLEIFEMNGRVGLEGVAAATGVDDVFVSVEAGANASLTFPQFILPISTSLKERLGQVNPKTRLLAGFTYTDRPEFNRRNTNFSNTYSWQNKGNAIYQVTLTDISLIESEVSDAFGERLRQLENRGNRLVNSFRPSLVTNMSASATWNFNSYGVSNANSSFFRVYIESGGTTLNFINTGFLEREALEFYRYYKLNLDFRKVIPFNKNTALAYRINAGFSNPYGENGILPYEKYFFGGGSNGIRAWRPRRLGPGSFVEIDTLTNTVSYDIEQPGEIILEGSFELRKNLVGFIDYAFFVDFGNTWTIREDATRAGSQLKADSFIKEIAVGTGFGLRFDFSFLVLRLDAGLKVYDPARPLNKRFILSDGFYDAPHTRDATEPIIINIGIGYPF